ncbi:YeeE/YedE family protein [Roseateles koreensis]|uniref:YeeE/YedE family protein n=1 Tax=Roseateles koreensis TaxID=2987526 RepID=A0ABT5KWY7_9BURK|nr:YeeE/YedE family protein [Roseateles koreensis]MDC8786863.1 YeeE/YedE family protein [Roseateles koreensis]
MSIDWNTFTPWSALFGGLLIGLATALYLLGNGRVAGITGIVASPLLAVIRRTGLQPEMTRLTFLLGLLTAPWLWALFAPLPVASVDVGPGLLIVAGLLVGVGVRMGNGCTSGHGVCGLSRFSLRSLVNVLCFMLGGAFSVWVVRHWL